SIDFTRTAGRTTLMFRHQSGLTPEVVTATVYQNLLDNGYNFYGAYGTAANTYRWLTNGSVSGDFRWADAYVNQIWLNSEFVDAFANLLDVTPSVPFNVTGDGMIQNAAQDPIAAGLNFGAFSP